MSTQAKTVESFCTIFWFGGGGALSLSSLGQRGCELIDLKTSGGLQHPLIQLFVEQNNGDGITLEQLEYLNRFIGDILDVEDGARDLFSGRYTLELSSPGIERPLTKKSHFSKMAGEEIKVRTLDAGQKATFQGELLSIEDEGFTLGAVNKKKDDDVKFVSWQMVQKANLVFFSNKNKLNPKNREKNVGQLLLRAGVTKKAQKRKQDI